MSRVFPNPDDVPTSLLVDFHAEHNGDFDYAVLVPYTTAAPEAPPHDDLQPPSNDADRILHVTWRIFQSAVHRGAHFLNPLDESGQPSKGRSIIATLIVADTIVYQTVLVSILRSGAIPFPISPRNTPEAIANLLYKTGCHNLVTSQGNSTSLLIERTLALLDEQSHTLHVETIPSFSQLFPCFNVPEGEEIPPVVSYPIPADVYSLEAIRIYFHSSGTTSLPKPISLNERYFRFTCYRSTVSREVSQLNVIDVASLPPFHVAGWFFQQSIPLGTGCAIVLWRPVEGTLPVPNPQSTLRTAKRAKISAIYAMPTFLVAWMHNPEAVEFLKSLDVVVTGGGPLPDEVGDFLASHGIKVTVAYGGTEFGICTTLTCAERELRDWNWLYFEPKMDTRLVPQDDSRDTLYELQVWANDIFRPSLVDLKGPDGRVGCSTKDLFQRHPTVSGLYKLIGRLDDQIVLASGEKVNPAPIEGGLLENPAIHGAVLIGRERSHVVLLVEPVARMNFDDSEEARSNLMDSIWPSIEAANRSSYTFARIFKEAIIFTEPSRPLPRTPKGTIQRAKAAAMYSEEVEQTYSMIATGKPAEGEPELSAGPLSWDVETLTSWLLCIAEELLQRPIEIDGDLFGQGADSLTSTILRTRIINALESSMDESSDGSDSGSSKSDALSTNIVLAYPTIKSLAIHLSSLRDTSSSSSISFTSPADIALEDVESLIKQYSHSFTTPTSSSPAGQTVLITGTTGSLGSYLLAGLIADSRVERVWALNRGEDLDERQRHAFADKDLDNSGLISDSGKVRFLSVDLTEPKLGLTDGVYNRLTATTTTIIHNAWRLDFNLTVSSFESNIRGTRHLADLALATSLSQPPRFIFASSVSAASNWNSPFSQIPESVLDDPRVCLGSGYGQSKFVTEKILEAATHQTGLRTTNIRIGQLCGGSNGFWSTTDWFPILVKTSMSLGCLPDALGVVSWLPLHHAASSILESTFAPSPSSSPSLPAQQTLHLQHTNPVSWTSIISSLSRLLSTDSVPLPIVPISEWLSVLEGFDSLNDAEHLPALKILPFFRTACALDESLRASTSSSPSHTLGDPADAPVQVVVDAPAEMDMDVDAPAEVKPLVPEALMGLSLSTTKMRDASPTLQGLSSLDEGDVSRWISYWRGVGFLQN